MDYIDIVEATRRLGKSDRQVRRMIHAGTIRIRPPQSGNSKLELLASDVDKLSSQSVIARQQERLDTLEQQSEALRQRVDTVSKQMDTMSMQLDTLYSEFREFMDDISSRLARPAEQPKILKPPQATYEPLARVVPQKMARIAGTTETTEGSLPKGYSAFTAWCEGHAIAETTARRKINPDNLKKGHWKDADGNLVKVAIDQAGQHTLWEIFHDKTTFQPCEQCPHIDG